MIAACLVCLKGKVDPAWMTARVVADNWGMSNDRELRLRFDEAAALYQDARPDYPEQLYADLLELTALRPPAALLEVGCGPGKATIPLARMGFTITAFEIGPALAEQARRQLADYPGVSVVNAAFEQWQPPANTAFDMVYAATAWKWIDPSIRYQRAADLLRPAGHLAVWAAGHAFPRGFDPFFTEIQEVYEQIGEARVVWPPPEPTPDQRTAAGMAATGHFNSIRTRQYVWSCRYNADRYIALLNTFSGHIAMDQAKRDYLYGEIRRRLNQRPDGQLTRHWSATLTVGRRR
jgi:SAM-dependent methyltransferase